MKLITAAIEAGALEIQNYNKVSTMGRIPDQMRFRAQGVILGLDTEINFSSTSIPTINTKLLETSLRT